MHIIMLVYNNINMLFWHYFMTFSPFRHKTHVYSATIRLFKLYWACFALVSSNKLKHKTYICVLYMWDIICPLSYIHGPRKSLFIMETRLRKDKHKVSPFAYEGEIANHFKTCNFWTLSLSEASEKPWLTSRTKPVGTRWWQPLDPRASLR